VTKILIPNDLCEIALHSDQDLPCDQSEKDRKNKDHYHHDQKTRRQICARKERAPEMPMPRTMAMPADTAAIEMLQ